MQNSIDTIKYSKAKLPTLHGIFNCYCFPDETHEHVAMVYGDITNKKNVITRIHSECFTGDLFGSMKCDCGEQLDAALKYIVSNGSGLVIYLKQEGRGIGLFNKLKAYELQDQNQLDTIESNHQLGFGTDLRSYTHAVQILNFFNINSIQLISNNPEKKSALNHAGITVNKMIELKTNVNPFNKNYLNTKKQKLHHKLTLSEQKKESKIMITAAYAQTINGTISLENFSPIQISNKDALHLTHKIRTNHDAILVGINTILTDNPRLTARSVQGSQPQPCIIDTHLRCDTTKNIFQHDKNPWIFTASTDSKKIQKIEAAGGTIFQLKKTKKNLLDLNQIIVLLEKKNIKSLLIEGGRTILTQFLEEKLIDSFTITLSPEFLSGTNVLNMKSPLKLSNKVYLSELTSYLLADNIIIEGVPNYV